MQFITTISTKLPTFLNPRSIAKLLDEWRKLIKYSRLIMTQLLSNSIKEVEIRCIRQNFSCTTLTTTCFWAMLVLIEVKIKLYRCLKARTILNLNLTAEKLKQLQFLTYKSSNPTQTFAQLCDSIFWFTHLSTCMSKTKIKTT